MKKLSILAGLLLILSACNPPGTSFSSETETTSPSILSPLSGTGESTSATTNFSNKEFVQYVLNKMKEVYISKSAISKLHPEDEANFNINTAPKSAVVYIETELEKLANHIANNCYIDHKKVELIPGNAYKPGTSFKIELTSSDSLAIHRKVQADIDKIAAIKKRKEKANKETKSTNKKNP